LARFGNKTETLKEKLMFKKSLLILSLLASAILIGCSTTENSNTTTANNSNSASGTTTTTTTSTPATTAPAAASTGDKIGVPECDDFIAKYEACVSGKVPEMARAQYQTMLKQWKDSWKKLAENPQTKGTLANACKQAREQQEAALKSFGCAL
jgi:hypothetical protein